MRTENRMIHFSERAFTFFLKNFVEKHPIVIVGLRLVQWEKREVSFQATNETISQHTL